MKNDLNASSDSQQTEKINNSFETVDMDINQEKRNAPLEKVTKFSKMKGTAGIPFIAKPAKDLKDTECELLIGNNSKKMKDLDYESPDEIDLLVSKINKSKGSVKIEDKGKLDFDEEDKKTKTNVNGNPLITSIFGKTSNLVNNSNINVTTNGGKISEKKNDKINEKNEKNTDNEIISKDKKINKEAPPIISKEMPKETSSIEFTNIKVEFNTNTTTKDISSNLNLNSKNSAKKIPNLNEALKQTPNSNQIINPYEVNKQETVYNSDLILCIFELCINTNDYGFKYKTKSRAFWEEIFKKENLKNIFANFKPDTLKKYWSILSEIKEYKKVIEAVIQHRGIVDSDDIKLLPLISTLADYIKNKKENLETALMRMSKRDERKIHNFLGNKRAHDDEIRQIEELDLGKNLRKNSVNPEDDPLLLDDATMEMLLQDEQKKKGHVIMTKDAPVTKNRVIFPNEKDKTLFYDIDNIVQSVQNHFNAPVSNSFSSQESQQEHFNKEEILDILKRTSFNIENTYLFLKDHENYKFFLFTDMEDYIIRNMRKSDYYKDLVKLKGRELVEERERFLMVDEE